MPAPLCHCQYTQSIGDRIFPGDALLSPDKQYNAHHALTAIPVNPWTTTVH